MKPQTDESRRHRRVKLKTHTKRLRKNKARFEKRQDKISLDLIATDRKCPLFRMLLQVWSASRMFEFLSSDNQ